MNQKIIKKSFDEIFIVKPTTIKQREANGLIRTVNKKVKVKLDVNTVNAGKRFFYTLIDNFFTLFLAFIFISLFGKLLPEYLVLIVFILVLIGYRFFAELFFQKTIGKAIFGYFVVNNYGEKPTFLQCLIRSIVRYLPLNQYSCLGSPSRGWHDKWSNTYVINQEELNRINNIKNIESYVFGQEDEVM